MHSILLFLLHVSFVLCPSLTGGGERWREEKSDGREEGRRWGKEGKGREREGSISS